MGKNAQIYLLLFSLYWAQGLPVGFMTQALPVILRAEGLSLAQIGGFGLLMLPWSIKVFWAPLVDRKASHRFGHYRGWIIATQLLSVLVLIVLSFMPIALLNEPLYLLLFFVLLLTMNTVVATQDIATDGLAVTVLKTGQLGWGNSLQVFGSRFGFIVGGGAMLWALDFFTWQSTFLILAVLVLVNTIPIIYYKESVLQQKATDSSQQEQLGFWTQIQRYLQYFSSERTLLAWLGVLMSFKVVDGLSGPILKPLLVDLGLSFQQIGIYITTFGACAALLGAVIAGWALNYLSAGRALLSYSLLKIVSMAAYAVLAMLYEQGRYIAPWWIYSVNAFEDFLSAMLLVVILSLIMQYSRKHWAATDFTFQVALMATVSGVLYSISGLFGDFFGYAMYLMIICAISFITILPILIWMKVKNL